MERIKQSLTRDYLPIKLDLNDLREIARILEGAKAFEITTGNVKCDSVNDLAEHFKSKTLYEMKLSTSNPYVNVEFNKFNARLYVGSDDAQGAGLFHKLDALLTGARRKPAFLYSWYSMWAGNALTAASPLFMPAWFHGAFLAIWFPWFAWVFYVRMLRSSEIMIFERHEKPGFRIRTRDQLAVSAISNLISLLFGATFGALGGPTFAN
jgi:hypothetical protein